MAKGTRVKRLFGMIGLIVMAGVLPLLAQQGPPSSKLSGKELAGKKLFLQRCSICHMPPLNDPDGQPYGPKLNGFVKDMATETRARETIRNGTPRMPGFQYGLEQEQIDNIIAYLKVFK